MENTSSSNMNLNSYTGYPQNNVNAPGYTSNMVPTPSQQMGNNQNIYPLYNMDSNQPPNNNFNQGEPFPPIIVSNQSSGNIFKSNQLGACSVNVVCPYCNKEVETIAERKCNCLTCLFSKFLFCIYMGMWCASRVCGCCGGGICNCKECLCAWFCCCDADHTCPMCRGNIGHYNSTPDCC